MGQPASTPEEAIREIALAALHPNKSITPALVRQSGLHREMLQGIFDALEPEIKNLVGWKELREFNYHPAWREYTTDDRKKGEKLTQEWGQKLRAAGLSKVHAIEIFDGERLSAPEPDYRLFLLRDGRLLHYAGGHYARSYDNAPITCGDVLTVMEALEERYPVRSSHDKEAFERLAELLTKALADAVTSRVKLATEQQALQERIETALTFAGVKLK